MWSVTLSRKWSNANFKVAGYQTSCFEMWPDVLPDFRYPSSLQLLINRVAVKTMVYMTCQRTAALHYPSVPASHPERGKRKIAAMWIWFIIPEMRQTVLTRKIRLISMQFKITIWLQQLKHTHTHKGRYAHSFSTLLHSTLHHRLLINHCIWLLIRPSLLKLLDLVSTFIPPHLFISLFLLRFRLSPRRLFISEAACVSDSPSGAFLFRRPEYRYFSTLISE